MPDDPTPESAATDPASDDQKERFRAALEAKKAQRHAGTSHESGGDSGKDHSSRSGGKREFRRKSGG